MITSKVQESQTLALLGKVRAMKAAGEDVVSFAAGEPDFDTPKEVIDAAEKSMRAGNTRYVASQGQANVREWVAKDARERLDSTWVQPEHVIVAGGAKQALYLLFDSILGPGDEAMIPIPYWVSYPGITKVVGGTPNYVKTQEANGYFPTVEELNAAYNPKVKALVFSSPSNPTGKMIDADLLRAIGEWCINKKVYLLYDELYERLVLNDEKQHVSLFSQFSESESEYLFSVNACSKTLAMTGWRLGWILGHKENIQRLTAIQSQMVTCYPGFVQDGVVAGLEAAPGFLPPIVEAYKSRRKKIVKGINAIPGLKCVEPDGAFYLFVNIEGVLKAKKWADDKEFAARVLEQQKVVVIPGSSFGMPNWIRLSFATSEAEIDRGIERLKTFCS